MMGHPGDAPIMPLAEEASKAGIKMMYQNVAVPEVRAKFGGGYVGAQLEPQGYALGAEAVRRFGPQGRRQGDRARRLRRQPTAPCAKRHRQGARGRPASTSSASTRRRNGQPIPNLAHPGDHRGDPGQPGRQAHRLSGGQLLGNAPTYMEAAGKKPGEIINIGFDTSPQIVEAFKSGWVQLTSDQQPFLQGYMPILSALPAGGLRPRRR